MLSGVLGTPLGSAPFGHPALVARPVVLHFLASRSILPKWSDSHLRLKSVLNSGHLRHLSFLLRNHNRATSFNNNGRALSKSLSLMGVIPRHCSSRVQKSSTLTCVVEEIFELYTNRLRSWISRRGLNRKVLVLNHDPPGSYQGGHVQAILSPRGESCRSLLPLYPEVGYSGPGYRVCVWLRTGTELFFLVWSGF